MRIACLQFAPEVGDVDNNLNRADEILDRADPEDIDLLVLPELAFTGYNFSSLSQISPFLENLDTGISSLWARTTALKHDCTVVAGYPEKVDLEDTWPANPEYYNSALVVNADGEVVANYRKSHLYYTDETWALEGPSGFFAGRLPGLPRTAMGICMDINPYRFQTPWDHFEFAHHVLDSGAELVVVSMAWLTQEGAAEFTSVPEEPDMNTLTYWVSRLEPIIRLDSDEEIIVVFANRTGVEGNAVYAGTSAVVGIQSGEVRIYGILGRGEKELLVVDTNSTPLAKLVYRPEAGDLPAEEATSQDPTQHQRGDHGDEHKTLGQGSEISSGASTGFESDGRNGDEKDERQLRASPLTGEPYRLQAGQPFFNSPGLRSPTESHFSVSSLDSSRLYWLPLTRSVPLAASARRTPLTDGRRSTGQASLARRQENRWSIRSDVSVWNNQPGRPRDMAHDINLPLESPLEDIAEPSYTTSRRPGSAFDEPPNRRYRPQETPPQQSYNRGRSSVPKRSISAIPDALGLHMANPEHEEFSPNDTTLEAELTDTARWVEATAATVGRSSARQETRSQPQGQTRHNNSTQRRPTSAKHPQTAAYYDVRGSDIRDEDYKTTRKQAVEHGDSAYSPILQPTSRSRLTEGPSAVSDQETKRLATDMGRRSARNLRRDYMHSSQPRTEGNVNARADSRGRQLPTTTTPSGQQTGPPSNERRHRSAQNSHGHRQEPVDLSQFRMIEEYPSATCPVHGSRSRSRARRTSSRQDTPGETRRRSRAREGRRRQEAEQAIGSPPTRPEASSRSSNHRAETPQATRAEKGAKLPSTAENSTPQLASRASTFNLRPGPKTPVAMVFVQDTKEPSLEFSRALSSLKCVDRGTKTPISRPRSAVW